MQADDFDTRFDQGEDMTPWLDLAQAQRPGAWQQHIELDLPCWMMQALEQEADRRGVTWQALIAGWLSDRLGARS